MTRQVLHSIQEQDVFCTVEFLQSVGVVLIRGNGELSHDAIVRLDDLLRTDQAADATLTRFIFSYPKLKSDFAHALAKSLTIEIEKAVFIVSPEIQFPVAPELLWFIVPEGLPGTAFVEAIQLIGHAPDYLEPDDRFDGVSPNEIKRLELGLPERRWYDLFG